MSYWRRSRSPRYSLLFALPLLALYETLAFALSHDALAGVRNGADVLLKSLFVGLGGRAGLAAFGALLVAGGGVLAWRDRSAGRLSARVFLLMACESRVYAAGVGAVVGGLTRALLRPLAAAAGRRAALDLPTQLMISLGAGIYEELLFRVLLVGALAWAARRALRWTPAAAGVGAAVIGALVFSAFHYVGPYGDRLTLGSFTFRTLAGLALSALYLLRGFGITAWTHALYDVLLAL